MGSRALATTVLVALCSWGCGNQRWYQADEERWQAWREALRRLAVEAVQSEKSFWGEEQRAEELVRVVLATPPDILREWGLYTWWAGESTITVDFADQGEMLIPRRRARRGRLGARRITVTTIGSSEPVNATSARSATAQGLYGRSAKGTELSLLEELRRNTKEMEILVGKKVVTEYDTRGRASEQHISWGPTVLDPK